MALLEDFTLGSVTSSALIGLGLVVAAPLVTTAGEEVNQIVAEARAAARPVSDAMPPPEEIASHIIRPEGASA